MTTKPKSNSAILPPEEMIVLRQAAKAFEDYASSTTLAGFATQRLSYAIQCHHSWLQQSDDKPGALSACDKGSEARKTMLKEMTTYFLGVAEKAKTLKSKDNDQKASIKTTRSARVKLLSEAFTLAVILDKHHVGFASFNVDKGTFTVPGKMFAMPGDTPLGRIANGNMVPVANEPAAAMGTAANGQPALRSLRTSVSQLVKANTPKSSRATGGNGDEDLESLVKDLHDILCDPDADDSEPVRKDSYPDAMWNYLGAIAAWYDRTVNNPAFTAKSEKVAA